ncbi:SDR family oxidoreductase [Pedobacter sp. MC2016-14]|uniref:SDR family NAD(P)-dependent oxidoreductase n=1 Tax=Pedobacter sp. MC2016-14 TaxID=2897327 RepID=UPI001E5BEE05|nr:SDR family oxidoreductase [Pedobacter sp. MC2016-14]MCD0489128.1 SDR family oxidoreductase [Pedobacter sp. MC2016-14]
MDKFALITGASKGIGKEIALLLAHSGYKLLLVARSEQELKSLSMSIEQQYGNLPSYFVCDLSETGSAQKVAEWSRSQSATLSVLINNAGYGLWGNFADLEIQGQMNMLSLNINAVVELTHLLLPQLKETAQSYILNLSSTAAYQAVPSLAVYAASKSFVLSYSRALRFELKDTSVSVSCLCPGPTNTGFASRAGLDAFADLAEKFNMSPVVVAKAGLKGMFNKKAEIIPGILNKLSVFGVNILPKFAIEHIAANLYKR